MGKGTINSHLGDGKYSITLNLETSRVAESIATLTAQIAEWETKIAGMDPGQEKDLAVLKKTSLEKRKQYLETNTPEDPTVEAWCVDKTEDLTGEVGTIEINGERSAGLLIQPGYDGNAAYTASRDGILQPSIAAAPETLLYNTMIFPGWQKWQPTYRLGTITAIDYDAGTCDIDLDPALSSAQSLNINQTDTLSDVPIEYMTCNASAFEVGDDVLIKFTNQDWSSPKVIGFKDNPQSCTPDFMWEYSKWVYRWNGSEIVRISNTSGPGSWAFSCRLADGKWGLSAGLHWFSYKVITAGNQLTGTIYVLNQVTGDWEILDSETISRYAQSPPYLWKYDTLYPVGTDNGLVVLYYRILSVYDYQGSSTIPLNYNVTYKLRVWNGSFSDFTLPFNYKIRNGQTETCITENVLSRPQKVLYPVEKMIVWEVENFSYDCSPQIHPCWGYRQWPSNGYAFNGQSLSSFCGGAPVDDETDNLYALEYMYDNRLWQFTDTYYPNREYLYVRHDTWEDDKVYEADLGPLNLVSMDITADGQYAYIVGDDNNIYKIPYTGQIVPSMTYNDGEIVGQAIAGSKEFRYV